MYLILEFLMQGKDAILKRHRKLPLLNITIRYLPFLTYLFVSGKYKYGIGTYKYVPTTYGNLTASGQL